MRPLLDVEEEGLLGALRAEFDREPVNAGATISERAWVDAEFEAHGTRVLYFDVQCTTVICRAEAGFDTALDFRDLGAVEPPPGTSVVQSGLVRRPDRPGLSILLYWGADGRDLNIFAVPAE